MKPNTEPYKPNKKLNYKVVDSRGKILAKFHGKATAIHSFASLKLHKHEKLQVLPLE